MNILLKCERRISTLDDLDIALMTIRAAPDDYPPELLAARRANFVRQIEDHNNSRSPHLIGVDTGDLQRKSDTRGFSEVARSA